MTDVTNIEVAGYRRGNGLISSGIRWWTHSLYSHVAAVVTRELHAGTFYEVYEANPGGFEMSSSNSLVIALSNHHDKGQLVDVKPWKDALTNLQLSAGYFYLKSITGQPYDYAGIAAFIGVGREKASAKFCSEAVMELSLKMGQPLQNMVPRRAYPDHCMISLALDHGRTIKL